MELVRTIAEVRAGVADARSERRTIALVPTMGYLHEGHLSLLRIAREAADLVVMSVFVNPLQFGPGEDLERYPRDLDRDLALAAGEGTDIVFAPGVREMYPDGEPWIAIVPERGADRLCGASRPGHFRGVLTVVAKLFGIVAPDVAVFGQKDYQQITLIRRMVADLNLPVRIEAGPIVREPDGLAMSSRNTYLAPDERRRALALSRALDACRALYAEGERSAERYRARMAEIAAADTDLEYAEIVDPESLEPLEAVSGRAVCAVAARVGATRLIDNVILEP